MKKVFNFCESYSVQIFVLILCVPALLHMLSGDINSYHIFFYFIDYSTGFGGKKLLAEICSLWLPKEVERIHILPLIIIVNTLMVGLFAWFCGKCLSRNPHSKHSLLVFIAIYLLSPFSFTMLIYMISRVDFYLATTTLVFLHLFLNHRGTWYYYLLTFAILCIACLIHHIFCNIFFPLVFALFIYDIFSDTRHTTRNIICYSAITLSVSILFFTIILFSSMNLEYEPLYNQLQERITETTSALSQKNALYYEFYAKLPEHYIAYVQPVWKYNIARFVLTFLFLSPLLLLFWIPWILAIRHASDRREKMCYILMQTSIHLIFLPAYLMAIDYDRWNCAYCFTQFCLTLLLYYNNTKTFVIQTEKVIDILKKHFVLVLLIMVYISTLEMPMGESTIPIVDNVCHKFGLFWRVNEILP